MKPGDADSYAERPVRAWREDCLIYVKECGRSVQSSAGMLRTRRPRKKKKNSGVRRWRGKKDATTAAGSEALVWAAADLHVSHWDKQRFLRDASIKRKRKEKSGGFLWLPLTQNQGKIHPHKTIPVSALLNQQRKSVLCLCESCRLINLPLRRRESGGRLSGENDTI